MGEEIVIIFAFYKLHQLINALHHVTK